ncbi:PREDICTED: chloride channel protein C-like isoform X1 [Nanorana parkeri]|uniref:chloride channel protein C-like isoform X1 n=1 Tax=Nanorana parkeri TaxID=125878 RepID=UPI000854EA7B|nr:PREDICTED: chloride channel protein C-like isoform X1 [Nanorana parkeri]
MSLKSSRKEKAEEVEDGNNHSDSVNVYHQKKELPATHESLDYLPSHSEVYKTWLQENPHRSDWDRWLMMALIGVVVGILGFLMHQIIDTLFERKWELVEHYIKHGDFFTTWLFILGVGLGMVFCASGLVVFLCPTGSPSGLPEVIGYLNGASLRHIFNIRTFLGTFFSCALAVSAGLFCGPEAPMVYVGAVVGYGLSQFKSETLRINLPFFTRFRNSADKRQFITAGAAAGIACVFRAPVGGLLFALEEVASFWDMKLACQIFFCCLIAALTTEVFSSSFGGFVYQGYFGFFKAEQRIIFWVKDLLDMSVLAFIPCVILGVIGGLLGALFVFLNVRINKVRQKLFNSISHKLLRQLSKLLETLFLMFVTITMTVYVPYFFSCTPDTTTTHSTNSSGQSHDSHGLWDVSEYNCPDSSTLFTPGESSNHTINQAAALLVKNGKQGIMLLFQRGTHTKFGLPALLTVLLFYFLGSCWTAGTAASTGLVVPMLYTGALLGRIVGNILVYMFGVQNDEYRAWIDPGLFAAIGSAAYFGGVSRLTISLTVIMVEITNDVQSILLIMVAVMIGKTVGDYFNHSLFSSLLHLKCIPHLEAEPHVVHGNKRVNLELFTARDVMKSCTVIQLQESVSSLAELLTNTSHNGFPVVHSPGPGQNDVFLGTITRMDLCMLLFNSHIFQTAEDESDFRTVLQYQQVTVEKLPDEARLNTLLNKYSADPQYQQLFINLEPYINKSAVCVQAHFSLQRAYVLFRTLGLRHLTVVDLQNRAVGMITRKDLISLRLEKRLIKLDSGKQDSDEELLR